MKKVLIGFAACAVLAFAATAGAVAEKVFRVGVGDSARGRGECEHRTGRETDQNLLHSCRPSVSWMSRIWVDGTKSRWTRETAVA